MRLGGRNDRRICIFEAARSRKGKLKNSQYRIMLPASDPRMVPSEFGPVKEMSEEALDAALYCGKVRSYNLSGANFIAYDDGAKPENLPKVSSKLRVRRQMVAMCFNKSTSRRVPMTMRMLIPSPDPSGNASPPPATDLLETLQAIPFESGQEVRQSLITGRIARGAPTCSITHSKCVRSLADSARWYTTAQASAAALERR